MKDSDHEKFTRIAFDDGMTQRVARVDRAVSKSGGLSGAAQARAIWRYGRWYESERCGSEMIVRARTRFFERMREVGYHGLMSVSSAIRSERMIACFELEEEHRECPIGAMRLYEPIDLEIVRFQASSSAAVVFGREAIDVVEALTRRYVRHRGYRRGLRVSERKEESKQ